MQLKKNLHASRQIHGNHPGKRDGKQEGGTAHRKKSSNMKLIGIPEREKRGQNEATVIFKMVMPRNCPK